MLLPDSVRGLVDMLIKIIYFLPFPILLDFGPNLLSINPSRSKSHFFFMTTYQHVRGDDTVS